MIRVAKPAKPPEVLTSKGAEQTRLDCAAYETGTREFTFNSTIYGHHTVKDALVATQHAKCCFCEAKVGHDGDVEHFRPKAGTRQDSSAPLVKPGYYWLAYHWSNLFLACGPCNSRHKRNLFPLAVAANRCSCHSDAIQNEQPLFLNPSDEDPQDHIGWNLEMPVPRTARGKVTNEALGLDRPGLLEQRRSHLALVRRLAELYRIAIEKDELLTADAIKQALHERYAPNEIFSACVKAWITTHLP